MTAVELWDSIKHRFRREGECLVWQGAKNPDGYGHFGRSEGGVVTTYNVHAVAFEAKVGPVPPGHELDHICRTPACAETQHLEPVTSLVNSMRGRNPNFVTTRTGVCTRGHRIEGGNVYRRKDGRLRCLACKRGRS